MLRSLPVGDPSRLYRIGDGDACCVQGGPQDRWGMFSFPLFERLKAELPEFEEITAFQAGGRAPQRAAPGRRHDVAAAALRVRHRQLLLDARRQRVRRPRVHRRRRHAGGAAGRRAEPPRLAGHLRRRSVDRRRHARHRGPSLHRRRRHAAGILRRNAARRSAGSVDSAPAGTADQRRHVDPPPAGVGVAARDRPAASGRDDRRHGPAAHRHPAPVDAARLRLSGELDARHHPGRCPSRSSPWCPPAPASAS